jgi:ribosomal protein S18 acetylase RimI-like enzyme
MDFTIRDATPWDIETIRSLADRIWRACYPGIISLEQIDYMLGKMYAPEAICADMGERQIRYLLIGPDAGTPAGFAAYGPGGMEGEMFLHRLYIDPERQRCGLGSALIGEIARRGRSAGMRAIVLRVNRGNRGAIEAYVKNGFAIVAEVCDDIGGGFVMDDYLMRLELGAGE